VVTEHVSSAMFNSTYGVLRLIGIQGCATMWYVERELGMNISLVAKEINFRFLPERYSS